VGWAEGSRERAAEIAAEFVRLKVDVIVTSATVVVIAAKQATSVIPIVFAAASDPVGTGLVASLARPGGNVTGLSLQFTDLAGKRLELLREVLPDLHRLAILANASSPATALEVAEVQAMARTVAPAWLCAPGRTRESQNGCALRASGQQPASAPPVEEGCTSRSQDLEAASVGGLVSRSDHYGTSRRQPRAKLAGGQASVILVQRSESIPLLNRTISRRTHR